MKNKKKLMKASLAIALVFGGVSALTGCNEESKVTISSVLVTGDFASSVKEFTLGSEVSLAGATVEVTFSDETKQTVTVTDQMWKKEDYDFTTLGEKEITIKFTINKEEKTEKIKIKIVNPTSVQTVIDDINGLSVHTEYTKAIESTVDSIKSSYNALSASNKALVTNYSDFFAIYKTVKKDVIGNYVVLAAYEEDDQTVISGYVTVAKEAIDAASDMAGVDSAISSAKTSIDAIETTLEIKKEVVLEAFDSYVSETFDIEDYSSVKWVSLQDLIQEARAEIENATDVSSLPNVSGGYSNAAFLEVDNLVTENFKNDVASLPEVSEITIYDSVLLNKVQNLLNKYDSVLTQQEKNRIDDELIDLVEAVELKLYTVDLDAFKADKIAVLDAFLDNEDNYSAQQWASIVSNIEIVKNDINNVTYSSSAKATITNLYNTLMDNIYEYTTVGITELNNLSKKLLSTKYSDINSKAIIFDSTNIYNIYDNKFVIGSTKYYVYENIISDGVNNHSIIDGKVTIGSKQYTVVRDLESSINTLKGLYNDLEDYEKDHYKILELKLLIEKYETVVYDKINYFDEKVELLEAYLDEDVYSEESLEIIADIIEQVKYIAISGNTLDAYKVVLDDYCSEASVSIALVNTKLDDIKATVSDEFDIDTSIYYEAEAAQIEEIIGNAILNISAVEKGNNETMSEAVARVQAMIDASKEAIDEVKTFVEVNTEEVNGLIAELKEYIDVNNYTDLEIIADLDKDYGEGVIPEIVTAYREAVQILEDSIDEKQDEGYFNSLANGLKTSIIDQVNRTYQVTLSAADLNEQIKTVGATLDPYYNNYYVEIGDIREYIDSDVRKQYSLVGNGLSDGSNVNGLRTLSDFKVENGKLYLGLPYLLFNGPSIEFNVSFGDLDTKDTYTITLDGVNNAEESVSISNISATNYGEDYDPNDEVGYFPETNTFASYNKGALLGFEYKNGENSVTGATIFKLQGEEGTYYSFVDLAEVETLYIYPNYPNGAYSIEWAIEEKSINFAVSIYNETTGIDVNDLELNYVEKVSLEAVKEVYSQMIDEETTKFIYDPAYLTQIEQFKQYYKNKIQKATSLEQLEAIFEGDGIVGSFDEANGIITIDGSEYTISEDKVFWYGVEVGSIYGRSLTLTNIQFRMKDNLVYIVDGESEKEIGTYDQNTDGIRLYSDVENKTYNDNAAYNFGVCETFEGICLYRTFANYPRYEVASVVKEEDVTDISFYGGNYGILDDNKVYYGFYAGFKRVLSNFEKVEHPVFSIDGEVLEVSERSSGNYYLYYEMKLGVDRVDLEVSGYDTSKFKVYVNDHNEGITGSGWYSIYFNYLGEGDQPERTLADYMLIVTKESAINNVTITDEKGTHTINGSEPWQPDYIPSGPCKISVDLKEGYTYKLVDIYAGEYIGLNDNVVFRLADSRYLITVFDKDGVVVERSEFNVDIARNLFSSITFNGVASQGNMYNQHVVNVYNEGSVDSVNVVSSDPSVTVEILDLNGNNLLDNEGNLNTLGSPFMRFKVKITKDGVSANSRVMYLINTNEYGTGELYESDYDYEKDEELPGLVDCIEFIYDSKIVLPRENRESWINDPSQTDVYLDYETIMVPKGYSIGKISINTQKFTRELITTTFTRCGSSNVYKLVVKNSQGVVDSIIYYEIVESNQTLDSDASLESAYLDFETFLELNDFFDDSAQEGMKATLEKGNKLEFSEQSYVEGDTYYLEGISKYYVTNVSAKYGDYIVLKSTNIFASYTINGDYFVILSENNLSAGMFIKDFKTGDVIVVDVTSSDGTTKYRYIYNLTREEELFSVELSTGEGDDVEYSNKVHFSSNTAYLTDGFMFGDFYDLNGTTPITFTAFVGELEVGERVKVNFNISEEAISQGVITFNGLYDPNDPDSCISTSGKHSVEVAVNSVVNEGVTTKYVYFYAHKLDSETKEEIEVVTYILMLQEDTMKEQIFD